ncbi:hypothetical protein OIU84_025086 [Salix udensis]|uniref:Uncharacterized protein n=1 Tax=Salix udensis TaxID=889485 RepID=A0AAD6KJ91_9ROSI|nr:hypothetical protein OIU84_025086 [Salix udensis]
MLLLLSGRIPTRKFICKDLQLWEVEDLRSRNGQLNILLNYHGFISQRFTINAAPTRKYIYCQPVESHIHHEDLP